MRGGLRLAAVLLAAVIAAGMVLPGFAAEVETEFIPIHSVEDLKAIAENPSGSYVLETDLDMEGVDWEPIDFTGVFDGGGHALLNLELSKPGASWAEVLDGNRKAYQACFAGLFGKLENAEVKNLKMVNVRSVLTADDPIFIGGIAGYSIDSQITGCTVIGVLELRAHNQIFGVGGVVGYGSGAVKNCKVDVTLICVDTDTATKDEQFLGGVYSTGFMDVEHCKVKILGFVSEHGYAHNGGIVGMYMQNPLGTGKVGSISYNNVQGKIKFFEDNRDRRAYCDAYYGEILASRYTIYDNRREFVREEIKKYDQEIRPCMCETPDIREWNVGSDCAKKSYGHHTAECYNCGYDFNDNYTLLTHNVTNWEVIEPASLSSEGSSQGVCDNCGELQTRVDPVLEPEVTETQPMVLTYPAEAPDTAEKEAEMQAMRSKIGKLVLILGIAVVILLAVITWLAVDILKSSKK